MGWRHVADTTRRTPVDWARAMQDLVEVQFPDAARIIVILDNLNTHRLRSLYATFPAAEARTRLTQLYPIPVCDSSM